MCSSRPVAEPARMDDVWASLANATALHLRARGRQRRCMSTVDVARVHLGTPPGIGAWVQRHPLVVCLPVQAALLFTDLGRLPVWRRAVEPRAVFGAVLHTLICSTSLLRGCLMLCDGRYRRSRALSPVVWRRRWRSAAVAAPSGAQPHLDLVSGRSLLPCCAVLGAQFPAGAAHTCLALKAGSRYARRPRLLLWARPRPSLYHYLPELPSRQRLPP
jgi:hypothetical protein